MTKPTLADLQKRLVELNNELNNPLLADEEYNKAENEQASVRKQIREFAKDRVSTLNQLVKAINEGNFTIADILAVTPAVHAGFNPAPKKGAKGAATQRTGSTTTRPSDAEIVCLTVAKKPGQQGRVFSYRKGRVYELSAEKNGTWMIDPTTKQKAFAKVNEAILEHCESESKLLELATDAGKTHFATADGKKELALLLSIAQAEKGKAATKAAAPATTAAKPVVRAKAKA